MSIEFEDPTMFPAVEYSDVVCVKAEELPSKTSTGGTDKPAETTPPVAQEVTVSA